MNIDYEEILLEWSYRLPKGFPTIIDGKFGSRDEVIILNQILEERGLFSVPLPEKKLSVSDLPKLNKAQQERGEVLYNMIRTGQSIQLSNGKNVVVDVKRSRAFIKALKNKQYDLLAGLRFFVNGDVNPYRVSSLEKTSELGGGKGMGGGAEQTATQESTQCLVNALRSIVGRDLTTNDLKKSTLKQASSLIDTTEPFDNMVSFLNDNPSWAVTCVNTANILGKTFKKSYKFFRGKGIVDKINQAAKSALRSAGVKANLNKWNPADIWMATDKAMSIEFPTNLEKLNALIRDLLLKKELVGVSLKKCVSGCELSSYNVEVDVKPTDTFKRIVPKDPNVFKTLDLYIEYNDGSRVQFRNFSTIKSWQGEIKGKEAAGGKIGHTVVSSILAQLGQPGLSPQSEVLSKSSSNNSTFIAELYEKYSAIKSFQKMSRPEFEKAYKSAPLGNRTSNTFNIELVAQLDSMSKKQKDQFISNLIGYAKSSSTFSSAFVKVS